MKNKQTLTTLMLVPIAIISLIIMFISYETFSYFLQKEYKQKYLSKIEQDSQRFYMIMKNRYKSIIFQSIDNKEYYDKLQYALKVDLERDLKNELAYLKYDGYIYNIDSNSIINLHTQNKFVHLTSKLDIQKATILSTKEGDFIVKKIKFKPFNWLLVISKDTKDLEQDITNNLIITLVFMIIMLFFIILIFLLVFNRYIKKDIVTILNHIHNKLANNHYEILQANMVSKETQELSDGLNNAILEIEKYAKQLEMANRSQDILLSLFDDGDTVLIKWNNDKNWSVKHISKSIALLLGYKKEEFKNNQRTYKDCIFKDDLADVEFNVQKALSKNFRYFKSEPFRVVTKNERLKWVISHSIPVKDKKGNVNHFISHISDITNLREREVILSQQSKLASMGEMIGNIAHQWRQPLSVISTGATGMLMQKKLAVLSDESFEKTCNMINDNVQHLSKTIDDFRNFIKGDREKLKFNVEQSINCLLNLLDGSIRHNNITMIVDVEKKIIIDSYENELTQCLMNIFNNAKDVLKENNKDKPKLVYIKVKKKDNNAVIKIRDNGGGIPSDILPKIFEPYFTTKHKSQGTGLGLNMTYNLIVSGLKGTIEAKTVKFKYQDKTYKGAEFKIVLKL